MSYVFLGLGGLGVLLLVYALLPRSASLQERMESSEASQPGSLDAYKNAQKSEDSSLQTLRNSVQAIETKSVKLRTFRTELAEANINLAASEWMILVGIIALLVFAILSIRFNVFVAALAGLPAVYFGQGAFIRLRQARRRRDFDNQLGDTLMLLSNALKAGLGFDQSIASVAAEAPEPIKQELLRYARQVSLGATSDTALGSMLDRNPSMDLNIAVSAVQINRQVGGNLSEVLASISETIRERVKVKQEIRTLTSQARFSGYLISILPVGLALFLNMVSPDYFRPMTQNPVGWGMLGLAAFAIAVGYFLIKKIVEIDI